MCSMESSASGSTYTGDGAVASARSVFISSSTESVRPGTPAISVAYSNASAGQRSVTEPGLVPGVEPLSDRGVLVVLEPGLDANKQDLLRGGLVLRKDDAVRRPVHVATDLAPAVARLVGPVSVCDPHGDH